MFPDIATAQDFLFHIKRNHHLHNNVGVGKKENPRIKIVDNAEG